MKRVKNKISPISSFVFLFVNFLLFSSCSSYRFGYIKIPENQQKITTGNLDSLQQKKAELLNETRILLSKFDTLDPKKVAVPAQMQNQFFSNLHDHFRIDGTYQEILLTTASDSVKDISGDFLMCSAINYEELFQDDKYLRRLINRGNQAFQVDRKTLLHSQKYLWTHRNRELLKKNSQNSSKRPSKTQFLCRKYSDQTSSFLYNFSRFMSEALGRLVAGIHKKPEPEKNVGRLLPNLKKWDIILQKSPGRLTDKFIPGYFGHAAIYLGDSVFAEGLHNGIVKSDPVHFAEGESFLIIRMKSISTENDKKFEQLVKGQMGKKYDFHYDLNLPDRLSCTELIYCVYEDTRWQTQKKSYGHMLFPDQIVQTAMEDETFCFPLFFDKNQMIETPANSFIESLLRQ